MTEEIKKISNFAKQNIYATYKGKAEVDKALRLLKKLSLHHSTYRFLSYFSRRGANGVTQAKIETICESVGVSLGTYHKTIKPDLKSFPEPLMIMIPSQKLGKHTVRKGSKRVLAQKLSRGSYYKVLQPLWKIEKWIPIKQEEYIKEQEEMIKKIIGEQEEQQKKIIKKLKEHNQNEF
jgi:hypothetical protein